MCTLCALPHYIQLMTFSDTYKAYLLSCSNLRIHICTLHTVHTNKQQCPHITKCRPMHVSFDALPTLGLGCA